MLTPGTVIGRDFRVIRLLREGGMGAVYEAEQISLGETRALKVMRSGIFGSDDPARAQKYRERFLEEARRSSGIRSAHVVKVVASGVDDATDTPWLAMELLHGDDLDGVLRRRGNLPWREVSLLFEQIGHGLLAAHAAGVLHLDLKPENVFVAEPESPNVPFSVKILDFGIGRVLEEHRTAATATTAVGSPLWMSPEQATKQQVSAASDIWALGLIAYRCLTGRHFWREANRGAEDFAPASWILELLVQPLDAASARAREQGVEGLLPGGFDAWFARCVTRDRQARWQRVDEMLDAFRRLDWGAVATADGAPSSPVGTAATAPVPTMALFTPPVLAASVPPTIELSATTVSTAGEGRHLAAQRLPLAKFAIALACILVAALAVAAGWTGRSQDQAHSNATPRDTRAGHAVLRDAGPRAAEDAPQVLSCPNGFTLVPGGLATPRASDGTGGVTPVVVAPFCLQTDETSVGGYRACIDTHACAAQPRNGRCNLTRRSPGDFPVDCVSWEAAAAWCSWSIAGGRLPTNAEWSLAAHRDGRRFPWGDEIPRTAVCWSESYPPGQTRPGTCRLLDPGADVSTDGIRFLGSSVAEWTSDGCLSASGAGHVVRGRSWASHAVDPDAACMMDTSAAAPGPVQVGFRCVVNPQVGAANRAP